MHPLLVRLPLGEFGLPLFPALLALTLLAFGVLALGVLVRRRSLFLLGVAFSVATLGTALHFRGHTFAAGPLVVSSFGALCALALGVGSLMVTRGARRFGLSEERAGWVLFATLSGALLGARVLYVLMAPLAAVGEALSFSSGGLSAAGAFVGGGLGLYASARRFAVDPLHFLDALAPALAFSIIALRLGCLLQGCDYGPLLGDSAPGVLRALGTLPRWPDELELGAGPPLLLTQIARGAVTAQASMSLPAHPTPLYEALLGAALLALSLGAVKRQKFAGQLGLAVVGGYSLATAALSPLIADPERGRATPWIFLGLGVVALSLWASLWRRSRAAVG